MAVDKVKPLKIESPSTGGTQTDMFPTEVNTAQDYLACKGISFTNSDTRLIDLDGSGNIQFTDVTETSPKTVRQLRTAAQNLFDNTSNGFTATNVQTAIEEAKAAGTASRASAVCAYGGQAKGKYLEFSAGNPGNSSPLVVPKSGSVKEVSVSFRTGSSPVGTFILYKNGSSQQTFTVTGSNPFYQASLSISFVAGDTIYIFGDNNSGTTLLDPVFYIWMNFS